MTEVMTEEIEMFLRENYHRIDDPIQFVLMLEEGTEYDDDNQDVPKGFRIVEGKTEIITVRHGNPRNNGVFLIVPLQMGVIVEEYGVKSKVHVFGTDGWKEVEIEINH